MIERNSVSANKSDGIQVVSPGNTIRYNVARTNDGWGVYTTPGTVGVGNQASGNAEPTQCDNIRCAIGPVLPA